MDYKLKYIKYKNKFSILLNQYKKQIGGGDHGTYCLFCGAPISTVDMELPKSKYNWLNDIIILLWNGKEFNLNSNEIDPYLFHIFGNNSVVHKDCYKIINDKYNNPSILNFKQYRDYDKNNFIKYNSIKEYMYQYYDWNKYFINKKDYFLESPLINKKNKKRIIDNVKNLFSKNIDKEVLLLIKYYENKKYDSFVKKFKLISEYEYLSHYFDDYNFDFIYDKKLNKINEFIQKEMDYLINFIQKNNFKNIIKNKKKNRPSPSESATLFNEGTEKKGNDGNIWIIKKNKNGVKRWSKK